MHVLSTPPAFVLSQDQTLQFEPCPSIPHSRVEHLVVRNAIRPRRAARRITKWEILSLGRLFEHFPCSTDRTLFSFQRTDETSRGLSRASEARTIQQKSSARTQHSAHNSRYAQPSQTWESTRGGPNGQVLPTPPTLGTPPDLPLPPGKQPVEAVLAPGQPSWTRAKRLFPTLIR